MFSVYSESVDTKGKPSLTKIGDYDTRDEANYHRKPRRHGEGKYDRTLLYRGEQFVNSTGW